MLNTGGAKIRRVPDKMAQLTVTSIQVDRISLKWSDLTDTSTGNSAITAYVLLYDNAGATIDFELLNTLATEFTATGLTGGQDYRFTVQACNVYGCGAASDSITVKASDVPDQIDAATTTASGSDIIIDWQEPSANFKSNLEYEIVL